MISKQIYFRYKYSWPILLHTSLLNHRFDREKNGYTSPREEVQPAASLKGIGLEVKECWVCIWRNSRDAPSLDVLPRIIQDLRSCRGER